MTKPTCDNCRFWEEHDSTCHRRKHHTMGFPFVRCEDWCGEHQPISRVTENLT